MTTKLKSIAKPTIHVLAWCMILVFTALTTNRKPNDTDTEFILQSWLPLIEAIIIFYFNYLFLIEKFIFTMLNDRPA
jgi:hypothetical protein